MSVLDYFNLDLMPEEPVLGSKNKDEKQRRARRRTWLTIRMYLAAWLGVISQRLLTLYHEGQPFDWDHFDPIYLMIALIIATVIFPLVFPRAFVKMPKHTRWVGTQSWRMVQFCIAFQQGFFWQALLSLLTPGNP